MNSAFICTQGTSISNGNAPGLERLRDLQRELQGRDDPWDFTHVEFERELKAKLGAVPREKLGAVSAELGILAKQGARNGDKVVLLCSDGYLGRICGEATKEIAIRFLGIDASDVEVVRVPDLQVKDGVRLAKFGIKNFIDCARKAIENYKDQYTTYLCPNGGYKGVVPFLTLLGMQYHCNVLYMFEFANNVVTLPPLPYVFDRDLYLRARKALALLTDKVEMREDEYLRHVEDYEDHERELFLGFVQHTGDGTVTPSPLVDAFVNESAVNDAMLSDQAFADLEREKKGKDYLKFCRLILNSQDPVWRDGGHHVHPLKMQTDLLAIKQVHTTLRLLGYFCHGRYYVARVLQHDGYDEAKKHQRKSTFPESRFSRWTPPAELDETGDNLSTESEMLEKNDALLAENRELKQQVDSLKARLAALEGGQA